MNFQPGQMIPQYNTVIFSDIYNNEETFKEDCKNSGLLGNETSGYLIKDENLSILFYLLYARYGNNPIANYDETQFKYKMFSIIFQYGPTWQKRLEIQAEIRGLTLDQAAEGARSIFNHAYNPENAPGTQTTNELSYINDQNVSKHKKSPIEAAMNLWDMLRVDVSEVFLKEFRKLFLKIVRPQHTYIYTTVED